MNPDGGGVLRYKLVMERFKTWDILGVRNFLVKFIWWGDLKVFSGMQRRMDFFSLCYKPLDFFGLSFA